MLFERTCFDEPTFPIPNRRARGASSESDLMSDVAELDALIAPDLLFANHLDPIVSKQKDLELRSFLFLSREVYHD